MTNIDISIIIPHKPMPDNDLALALNLQMLSENSTYAYELIIDNEVPKCPYKIWNERAKEAQADIIVLTNSDVLMAQGWDLHFVKHMCDNAIFMGYLVEPGNVGVASENLPFNFGKTPETFNRDAFEQFARDRKVPDIIEQRGWYMPSAFRRDWFLSTGGFDVEHGAFPSPLDILFFNRCRDEFKTKFMRVKSFAYHFQALSHRGY